MKKISSWLFLSILIVSLFGVSAVGVAAAPSTGVTGLVSDAFDKIISIGSLEFLLGASADSKFVGFLRLLVGILIFSIFFAGASAAHAFIPRNVGITISIIMAILSAVFIPGSVLAAIGSGYAVLFSSLLIGIPVFVLMYFIFGTPSTRLMVGFKLGALLIVWWVLIEVGYWANSLVV